MDDESSTETFPAYDRSGPVEVGGRHDELAAQALVVALSVVVLQMLVDRGAQVALSEKPLGQARDWRVHRGSGSWRGRLRNRRARHELAARPHAP